MLDSFGRNIDYMRVSITDRCNLRCVYCMPEDLPDISHENILKYEEILRICRIMAKLGIRTVKVTGGEPLVRKGCAGFLRELKAVQGIENVTLTTNGTLFPRFADKLIKLGLDGVNISLDTADESIYREITGSHELQSVLKSIDTAVNAGMNVKVNCVPARGLNDGGIVQIARLAEELPVYVRFIELMPKGAARNFEKISSRQILDMLMKTWPDLTVDDEKHGFGPAVYYKSSALKGGIGLISAISGHFCDCCNRVRLSSDGFLKLCLYHDDGLDLRSMLREGAQDIEIVAAITSAVMKKPEKHFFEGGSAATVSEGMSRIGG